MLIDMSETRFSLLFVIAWLGFSPQLVQAQHVHGVVELGIVVEGDSLSVSLQAPMDDVIGFEHAPRSEEQKQRVVRAAALLSDASRMIGTPDAASCSLQSAEIEAPDFMMEMISSAANGKADAGEHDEEHHEHDDDHHDKHEHDDHHGDEHDDHADDDHGDEHSEVRADYRWHCEQASGLDALQPSFIDGFHQIEKIEVQILTAAGARVMETDASAESISLADE